MIIYLFKSTLCLGILLLFYKHILEDVAINRMKRAYLLFALTISFVVPMLPTGYVYPQTSTLVVKPTTQMVEIIPQPEISPLAESMFSYSNALLGLVLIIALFFYLRSIKNIFTIIRKSYSSEKILHKGRELVLLEDHVTPHTFFNKIYVNKQDYLQGHIDDQLLAHEQAHADQKHSYDVLFIEFLICLFWFNPILRLYKKAIQLNHEFLADEAVINQYKKVKKYQYLLLDVIKNNNQVSLASSINFHLTKKRLEMMTKESTVRQKVLVQLSVFPLILVLIIAFGRPANAQNSNIDKEKTTEKSKLDARDAYFKNAIFHYRSDDGRVMVKSYSALPDNIKDKIPPMPPLPPPPPGESRKSDIPKPLGKGTIVRLKENGSIKIGNGGENAPPPPPPPPAPKGANGVNQEAVPPPPPPPPPPPILISDLAKQGAKIYLNGKLVKAEIAETICEKVDSKSVRLVDNNDGTQSLYIDTKD